MNSNIGCDDADPMEYTFIDMNTKSSHMVNFMVNPPARTFHEICNYNLILHVLHIVTDQIKVFVNDRY